MAEISRRSYPSIFGSEHVLFSSSSFVILIILVSGRSAFGADYLSEIGSFVTRFM